MRDVISNVLIAVFEDAGTLAVSVVSYATSGSPLGAPSAVCNRDIIFNVC